MALPEDTRFSRWEQILYERLGHGNDTEKQTETTQRVNPSLFRFLQWKSVFSFPSEKNCIT